ncbi:putative toxin-antitoxin system toxin component, PIN family [Chromatiaceae bacterium AAb-1]|nr:putative toxin-antitoxin system toxin component, PIN family [Chromatiaceae bacterium AAb-1]
MKVVVDTNVLIAALLSGKGSNREVIRHCLTGRLLPQLAAALYFEYEDVFERQTVLVLCKLNTEQRTQFLDAFLSVCQWNQLYFKWRPNLRDEGDNHLVELAVASNARYLVTNNIKDFRFAELKFPALEVIKPEQLLELLT